MPHAAAYDAERQWAAAFFVGVKVAGVHLGLDAYKSSEGGVEPHGASNKAPSLHNTPKPGLRAWTCAARHSSSLPFPGALTGLERVLCITLVWDVLLDVGDYGRV